MLRNSKKATHLVYRDGELMDNAFVFARREHHVHEGQLQLHRNKGGLARISSSTTDSVQGSVTGYKDVSKVDGRAPMPAVARQHVSAAIKADQSSFQSYRSECEQTVKLVRRTTDPEEEVVSEGSVGTMHP